MNLAWSWCMIFFLYTVGFGFLTFFWEFCIYIQQGYWPIIFYYGGVFVWFWYQYDGGFIEEVFRRHTLRFNLLEKFDKNQFSFVCLVEFTCEVIWSWICLCGSYYYYCYRFYFLLSSDMRGVLNSDILFQMTSVYPLEQQFLKCGSKTENINISYGLMKMWLISPTKVIWGIHAGTCDLCFHSPIILIHSKVWHSPIAKTIWLHCSC